MPAIYNSEIKFLAALVLVGNLIAAAPVDMVEGAAQETNVDPATLIPVVAQSEPENPSWKRLVNG